jgi:hypothetical protein
LKPLIADGEVQGHGVRVAATLRAVAGVQEPLAHVMLLQQAPGQPAQSAHMVDQAELAEGRVPPVQTE